jgi:hypothetical protein
VRIPRWEAAYRSRKEAREAFDRMVDRDPVTPLRSSGVWRVRLVLDAR